MKIKRFICFGPEGIPVIIVRFGLLRDDGRQAVVSLRIAAPNHKPSALNVTAAEGWMAFEVYPRSSWWSSRTIYKKSSFWASKGERWAPFVPTRIETRVWYSPFSRSGTSGVHLKQTSERATNEKIATSCHIQTLFPTCARYPRPPPQPSLVLDKTVRP